MPGRPAAEGQGGSWVVAQFAVIAAIAALWLAPVRPPSPAGPAIGLVLTAAGLALAGSAYRAMGRSFTAFPRPLPESALVTSGPFRLVRHPTYGGGCCCSRGCRSRWGPPG